MTVEKAFILRSLAWITVTLLGPTLCHGLRCVTCNNFDEHSCLTIDSGKVLKSCSEGEDGWSSSTSSESSDADISSTDSDATPNNDLATENDDDDYDTTTPYETSLPNKGGPEGDFTTNFCFTKRVLSESIPTFEYAGKGCQTKQFFECLLKRDDAHKFGTNCVRIHSDRYLRDEPLDQRCDDAANEGNMRKAMAKHNLTSRDFGKETIEICFCDWNNCNDKSHSDFKKWSRYPNFNVGAKLPHLSISASMAGLIFTFCVL